MTSCGSTSCEISEIFPDWLANSYFMSPQGLSTAMQAPCGSTRFLIIQQLKGSCQIPQGTARSLPQAEDSINFIGQCPLARATWAYTSPYLEVAPDKLSHGVVVDIQGQCDTGLSLEPGSPHGGHLVHLGWPEACGERRA